MIIYKAIFPNGKVYIGKTITKLEKRIYKHVFDSRNLKTLMANAINKYGKENIKWEILKECLSIDELNFMEKHYIQEYNSNNFINGYNITEGGDGGDTISNNINRIDIIKERLNSNGYNPENYIPFTEELENEIIKKYTDEKYSIRKLVKEYKITKNRITRLLKSKNIEIDLKRCKLSNSIKLSDEQINDVVSKYKNGNTIKIIAEEEKLTIQTVSRVLHDLELRISKRFKNGKRYDGKQPKRN